MTLASVRARQSLKGFSEVITSRKGGLPDTRAAQSMLRVA